jgi:hypothetical protein
MTAALPSWVRKKADAWAMRALARDAGEVFLTQRRVYIVPTGAGAGFLMLLLVLLIVRAGGHGVHLPEPGAPAPAAGPRA